MLELQNPSERALAWVPSLCILGLILLSAPIFSQELSILEVTSTARDTLTSQDCLACHEESRHQTSFDDEVEHSVHRELECLDCHPDRDTEPHPENIDTAPGSDACGVCHPDAFEQYQVHGREKTGTCVDVPCCSDCHGDHDILPSDIKRSRTHPVNLPGTCGRCHEDLLITRKYEILLDKPIEIYQASVHGQATRGGVYVAATCNDCHSSNGTAHRILSPGDQDSSINHFNIPKTCGRCHKAIESDFFEGIHGKLVARGETDAPVCTNCHGEHGIIDHEDPRSPVSRSRVAAETCSPCHESAVLSEKYGLPAGRLASFVDSYHGLKSRAGDTLVANCASCHGVHRILPSSDPSSTIHPSNLQTTCGDCHPGISQRLAEIPIHGVTGQGLRTKAADIAEVIYIVAIVVIIGLMVLHWMVDYGGHLRRHLAKRPQVLRMRLGEIWQHALLMVSFVLMVISGFSLRFSDGIMARTFFGWEGGFQLRGTVHRTAAVLFIFTAVWHLLFVIFSPWGRGFLRDIKPSRRDFRQFLQRILYNLGRRREAPRFGRFSYVEKAEYWALVWGTVVMAATGLMLWFDNWVIQFLPKGFLDVCLVVHYWEAWLASLAIFIWHLYSTIFSPYVYPGNPSWLTGTMPNEMYRREHPEHYDAAIKDTEEMIQAKLERVARREEEPVESPEPVSDED